MNQEGKRAVFGRRTVRFYLAVLAVLALQGCASKLPERGTPEWRKRLGAGEALIETTVVPGTALKLGSATGLVDAPIETAWELFADANQWSQFLWKMKESREMKPQGESRMMEVVIEPPGEAQMVGFNDIRFKAEISETVNLESGIWRADYNALEGNIRRVYGSWQLERYGPKQTLVTFSSFNDFGYPSILDAAVNLYTERYLTHWSHDIRDRLKDSAVRLDLEQRAAIRAGRDPSKVAPMIRGLDDFVR